jgi:hypothetical protein
MRFLLLFLICLTAQARAQFNWLDQAFLAQGPNATVLATGPVTGGTDYALFNGTITTNGATFFTASATGTAGFCDVRIKRLGSPTGTITAQVWTYNSGSQQAGSAVGTPSSGISAASISTSYSLVRFTGMSASITLGTSYCLTLTSTELWMPRMKSCGITITLRRTLGISRCFPGARVGREPGTRLIRVK